MAMVATRQGPKKGNGKQKALKLLNTQVC